MNEVARVETARLLKALRKSGEVQKAALWTMLTPAERERALRIHALADPEHRRDRAKELGSLLYREKRGFRPATVMGWSAEQLCAEVAKLPRLDAPGLIESVVLKHHDDKLATLQAPFLDRLTIEHVGGIVEDGALDELHGREGDEVCQAALDVWREIRTRDMALYLLALPILYSHRWQSLRVILPTIADELELRYSSLIEPALTLVRDGTASPASNADTLGVDREDSTALIDAADADDEWLDDVDEDAADVDEDAADVDEDAADVADDAADVADDAAEDDKAADTTAPVPAARSNPNTAALSPLDEQIILRIADSLQRVVGAPDEATLDAIIDELVRLNGSRHQSFYHLGFHDAVRGRPARGIITAQNATRWRWYLAGYVAGLARLSDWLGIAALYDQREEVRSLGDNGVGPSRYAAQHITRALIEEKRPTDAVAFVSPTLIERNPQVGIDLLGAGTALLREQRLEVAAPIFELLLRAARPGVGSQSSMWATVKRRYAHCLRAEDKLEAARGLLEEALDEGDTAEKAMVLVDLGLIDAGFGRLADLRLPENAESACETARRLERGLSQFNAAERLDVHTSSHARYVLGMKALLERDYPRAETYLAFAVSAFDLERDRYAPAGLLARAHLHLAVARCANLESDPQRLAGAVADIDAGLIDVADLPDYFAEELIAALSLRAGAEVGRLIEALIRRGRESLLDALRYESSARKSVAVADMLASRFRRVGREFPDRIEDGCALVEMLLLQGRHDEASGALDELERLTLQHTSTDRFLNLLAQEKELSAVWEPKEIVNARVRFLEGMGRYHEASEILIAHFHRAVARNDEHSALEADDILETLGGYTCCESLNLPSLRQRLERSGVVLAPLPVAPTRPIKILVVGGNETQASYDADLRAYYRTNAPWLTVEFLHSGWSSNWGDKVDEFQRRLACQDGVVLIYLMRTEFGRAVRKRMGSIPWRACTGKGKNSIRRAIDAAAAAVAHS